MELRSSHNLHLVHTPRRVETAAIIRPQGSRRHVSDGVDVQAINFGAPGDHISDEDRAAVEEIAVWLRENADTDATVSDRTGRPGIVPFIPLVIGIAIGVAALARVIAFLIERFNYEQIITYHDGKVTIQVVKEIRNGKILIFADKDTVVQINNVDPPIDLTEIAKAAISAGASDAADKAKDAGKDASVEKPTDDATKKALVAISDGVS